MAGLRLSAVSAFRARWTRLARTLPPATFRYLGFRLHAERTFDRTPLDDLLHALARPSGSARVPPGDLAIAVRLAERLAPRLGTGRNTCLFRALARFGLLSSYGLSPVFAMGARPALAGPGHAWVELDGEPFLEQRPVGLIRTFTYRAA